MPLIGGIPPPPRISGISDLAENSQIIYGAQSFTGKIFISKNLDRAFWNRNFKKGKLRALRESSLPVQGWCDRVAERKVRGHTGLWKTC